MEVFSGIDDIRRLRWADPSAIWGFVPTMSFLHEGHLSLVRRARQENEQVGVSIFVNPTQFNDPKDLETYPIDLDRDLALLKKEGADLVWMPSQDVVYPPRLRDPCRGNGGDYGTGRRCPARIFHGVATVVAKLFNAFQPQRTYFGQKDAQQAVVIKRMVKDLSFNIEVIICPTVREADGLAMSSRNANLTPAARRKATCLYHALCAAKDLF